MKEEKDGKIGVDGGGGKEPKLHSTAGKDLLLLPSKKSSWWSSIAFSDHSVLKVFEGLYQP